MFTVAVGSDHLGVELREIIADHLRAAGHEITSYGCEAGETVDYPDVAVAVAQAVAAGTATRAVLVCGTGIGMAISANKVPGVRAAAVTDVYSAERAMKSNNAQVLCLGSLVVGRGLALALVDRWIESEFAGGQSARKVEKVNAIDALTISAAQ